MSDLSWLNPTPHAIAVYASRPLSPVATQHSLPSGRYPLLGPDLHRLDRTSVRLAHSIDNHVGAREHGWRNFETERFRGLKIDRQLIPGRLLDGQVRRFFAVEDFVHIECVMPIHVVEVRAVTHKSAR